MNISDFVTSISGGIARTNRFTVVMDLPWVALPVKEITPFTELRILCDQVQLPGLNMNTSPNRTFGEIRETPYELAYEPIQFTFYSDAGMNVNAYFSEWIKNIQHPTRRSFRYYDDYICKQMQILVQDTEDYSRYQVNLYEVYPKSIGAVQLDYASKDVMKFTVTMVYKYWEYAVIDKPKQQQTGNIFARGLVPGIDFSDPGYDPDTEEIVEIEEPTTEWGDEIYDDTIPGNDGGGNDPTYSDEYPSQGVNADGSGGNDYQNDVVTADGQSTADEYTDANPFEEEFGGYEGDDELDF
jgi:hypothetical protein